MDRISFAQNLSLSKGYPNLWLGTTNQTSQGVEKHVRA